MANLKWHGMLLLAVLSASGCVSHPNSFDTSDERGRMDSPQGANLEASSDLLDYSAGGNLGNDRGGSLEEKAVRDAGRRLGATAGYRDQAEALYKSMEQYDTYLTQIFDFNELLLPKGIIPPVLAQTTDTISFDRKNGVESKTVRARVLKTVRDAKFANPSAPTWRNYLRLETPPLDKPLPQLQAEIDKHRASWQQGVREGYQRGTQQARQAFEISINELDRDYVGMQLFYMLWMAGQVEAPNVIEQTKDIVGGGKGSREMSLGVRRVVMSEPAYFINDTSEWTALIASALEKGRDAGAGLSDVMQQLDNTTVVPEYSLEPDLNRAIR